MKGLDKFLISFNPAKEDNFFILHTQSPHILAEAYEFGTKEEADAFNQQVFEMVEHGQIPFGFVGRSIIEGIYIVVVALLKYDGYPETQKEFDEVASVLRQMAEWYAELIDQDLI